MSLDKEIHLHFRINYHTHYGQDLMICGSIPELGNWKEPVPMTYHPLNDEWDVTITIPGIIDNTTITYKYLVDSYKHYVYEPGKDHRLNLSKMSDDDKSYNMEIIDTYRWQDNIMDAYTRSTFVDVINQRDTERQTIYIEAPTKPLEVYFSCVVPNIKTDEKLYVVGSCPELGFWDPTKGVLMRDNDYPVYSVIIPFDRSSLPFEYKYVIIKANGDAIWDQNQNMKSDIITSPNTTGNTILCLNQFFVNPCKDLYHGFGVYVPIFSLRSSDSCGIGQYTDIKKLVNVCNKIGASMIQLLPINDTTDKGEWDDSYPYRQASCFALHPIYVNLLAIKANIPPKLIEEIKEFAAQQEKQKTLDYPAVYAFKMEKLAQIYEYVKDGLDKDEDFNNFKIDNGKWLRPYAIYCYFREKYGTSDFNSWPDHNTVTEAEIDKDAQKYDSELNYTYWIQYVCDQQFRESRNYAQEHHVALKGDLPIGVYLNSVECWAYRKNFRLNMCAGAPPDAFSDQGQNWGFPTYDWDYMERDNLRWWKLRLERMSTLFHTLRVDHILGFFRIWEIPRETSIGGILGHYFPSNAATKEELLGGGLWDIERYVKPYIRWHLLYAKFGSDAEWVSKTFFKSRNIDPLDDWYDFKDEYNSEKKIEDACQEMFADNPGKMNHYKKCLTQLIDDVLLIRDPKVPNYFYPRTEITMEHTEVTPYGINYFASPSWVELSEPQRTMIRNFYTDFTYKRQNSLWVSKAIPKLQLLKNSTNMLICGEDLGQLTDNIIEAIQSEALLSLRVQRMPKDSGHDFDDFRNFSYLSICCPSTHDCSSIRGWWEENPDVTRKFWNEAFLRYDNPPRTCEPWISETILKQHLYSNSMWAVFLLQDITGITEKYRRQTPQEEQINIPANSHHHWNYRFPYTLEELANDDEFTGHVHQLCEDSHRI